MKATDRTILIAVALVAMLAAAWFLLLAPKRSELSDLDAEVATLQTSVAQAEQLALAAEDARENYNRNYQSLVVLGKAVPGDDDAASLLVQTSELARQAKVDFRKLDLVEGSGEPPPPPAAAETTADGATPSEDGAAPAPAAAPATETTVATLPIGATVGTAGLPVMPYAMRFHGEFFQVVDFLGRIDAQVEAPAEGGTVDGRLMTVDGFGLQAEEGKGFPHLDASLHVTTFVTPADQGVTAGATPTAPPTSVPAEPVPTSTP